MAIDILMVMLLPLLMAYSLIGENIHEVMGICMFALFIAHHVINRKWWMSILKGKYNAVRILNTSINLLLAVYMILQPVSGILMSKYVLKDVTISGASGLLRTTHMTLAYWGFILMSFHLGLHPGDVVNIPANVKHWHGAASDSWFQHIAQEIPGEDTKTEWCEAVSDEDYGKLQ